MEELPIRKRERIFVARKIEYHLDSTSHALLDILSTIEAEGTAPFGLTGGFVRNLLANKPYNDFDISSENTDRYRIVLIQMNLLSRPTHRQINGIKQHDRFMNPYDIGKSSNNLHWIETNEQQGFPPNSFDFSVNEFTIKSDGLIHAPTYAWRHWDSKLLKANRRPNMVWTTNLILRAVRFASLLDFKIDKDDFTLMKERLGNLDVDTIRCIQGFKKIIEDNVEDKAMEILLQLEFPMTSIYKDIRSLKSFYEKKLIAGQAYSEAVDDYHDMEGHGIDVPGMPQRQRDTIQHVHDVIDIVRAVDPPF